VRWARLRRPISRAAGGAIIAEAARNAVRSPRRAVRRSRDHFMIGPRPSIPRAGIWGLLHCSIRTEPWCGRMGGGTANISARPSGAVRGTYRPANPNQSRGFIRQSKPAPCHPAGRHRRTEGCESAVNIFKRGKSGGAGGGCDYFSHAAISPPKPDEWGRESGSTLWLP
jgi:hypothetical protein